MKLNKDISRTLILLILIVFYCGDHLQAQENSYYFPVRPDDQNYLAGTMGELRNAHFHGGIDIKTSGVEGLPVYAAEDGYISRIKVSGVGYGNALYIAHPQKGTTTVYGHLQRFKGEIADFVRQEQYRRKSFEVEVFPAKDQFKVSKGEQIAYSGNTGGSSGPHLHFEIRDSNQRPLNPLDQHFDEIKDNIPPAIQNIAIKTLNINSRVENQFGVLEFNPTQSGGKYSISTPIDVYGEIGIMLRGYDRLNGVPNQNGIPHISVKLDQKEILQIDIDKIPFNKNRFIFDYYDYEIKQSSNETFQKLYIDDGNDLQIYPRAINRGKINITDTLIHQVEITLKDAYNNTTVLDLRLKGQKPTAMVISGSKSFHPNQNKVIDNTLEFMGHREENNGYFATVYANRMVHELSTSYYVNNYAVYLWDLRKGLPDSIDICGTKIYPKIEMMVPSASEFKYYQPRLDLIFHKNSLFDTLYLKTDYLNELDDDREYFEISDPIVPLNHSMTVILKPLLHYDQPSKVSAYYTTDLRNFSYSGGNWKGDDFEFSTNTFGKYTLLEDTIPPHIHVVEQDRNHFRCYITDKHSGIKDYRLTIGGEWVLLNYDPKRDYFWSEKLDETKPFQGDLELKVVDNVNNEKIYSAKIN